MATCVGPVTHGTAVARPCFAITYDGLFELFVFEGLGVADMDSATGMGLGR